MIKQIKNFILDSGRELMQILILFICLIVPTKFNLAGIIKMLLGEARPTLENAKYYFLMVSGNWTIGILSAGFVLIRVIRNSNKHKIFNKGNIYHNKPYWWYWLCSKILGYEKCNLILVPIATQYKLILRETFAEYPFGDSDFPQRNCQIDVKKSSEKFEFINGDVSLIIEDTYPILPNQIPSRFISTNFIWVRRESLRLGERVYSEELVNVIIEEIRGLGDDITLNIFSTTNPKNTFEIVKKAIFLADRGNIKHVYVFQQEGRGKRCFEDKSEKVL